jgi:alpha-D-xyloside xylohydrolase
MHSQHGARPTEIWLYGNESEAAIVKMINWRKSQKSYIMAAMEAAADTGMPVNRPLFFDFPGDPNTWGIKDQYMFGPDYLVAPVTDMGSRNWTLYLPGTASTKWTHVFSDRAYDGGQRVTIDTPLDEFPLFKRA